MLPHITITYFSLMSYSQACSHKLTVKT
ncbi:hypothetical protein F383_26847 [Gossypium arboreum]|uniref:Uncharacterized protein n=1 Tax=Gossypium arboreum TaxID=29729 RepID=A0A0B0MS27_GOSAR|nr:hypothetical protein F383_26847 [Gossypium arboreum]